MRLHADLQFMFELAKLSPSYVSACRVARFFILYPDGYWVGVKGDASRDVAPTRPAEDAIMIDTSLLDRDEVLKAVMEIVREQA
jgi:hypothetical protein